MQYKNFDISILPGQAQSQYLIYVSSQTQGEATSRMNLDSASDEMVSWLKEMDEQQINAEKVKEFGLLLFKKLFYHNIKQLWDRSLGEILLQPDVGLRVRLRIEPSELAALPWEYLYCPERQLFLATSNETPLIRYINLPDPIGAMAISGPVRGLVIIPNLRDLNTELEKNILQQAFANIQQLVAVDYLEGQVTPARIRDAFRQREYHLIHYIGHGEFGPEGGRLFLNDDSNSLLSFSDEQFGAFFTDNLTVKLVVLNTCQGSKQSSSRALAGIAAQLVKRGLPAVVAMQYSITDADAIFFSKEFYSELCASKNSGMIDYAISRARNALWQESALCHAFGNPVLFMRSLDEGRLWQPLINKQEQIKTTKPSGKRLFHKVERLSSAQKIFLTIIPVLFLVIVLIILASIQKQQFIEIDANSKDFVLRCLPSINNLLIKSFPVQTIHFSHFGQFALMINEIRILPNNEILYKRSSASIVLTISPHHPLFSGVWIKGNGLRLKEISIQPGLVAYLNMAEDSSITINLSRQTNFLKIQLSDTLEVTVQKCSFRISGDKIFNEYDIDRQSSFLIIKDKANLILDVPPLKSDVAFSFFVSEKYFENNETLLETEISTDSISFSKFDITNPKPISSITELSIKFPEMNDMIMKWDNFSSVYVRNADLKGFILKYLRLQMQTLGFQIQLCGKSTKIEVGTNINYINNIMPSILEWLWLQKKIVLIVTCLVWLLSTQIALWSILRKDNK